MLFGLLRAFGLAFFIVFGLIGLSKLEWVSAIYYVKSRKSSLEEVVQQLRLNQAQGRTEAVDGDSGQIVSIDETLEKLNTLIENFGSHLNKIGEHHKWKHQAQKYSFAIGLLGIAFARGINAIQAVILV